QIDRLKSGDAQEPLPLEKPATPAAHGPNVGIVATVFGGRADPEVNAYTGKVIDDVVVGCSLPARIVGARPNVAIVNNVNGKQVVAEIMDVGPWNTTDPYWETGARPQAESGIDLRGRKTNRAGIDLTPACAKAIGVDGKGVVDWTFVP